jgi:chemotaxis signal transduction protein
VNAGGLVLDVACLLLDKRCTGGSMTSAVAAEKARPNRVLVFAVDDSRFCVDLDWVDAVQQRREVRLNTARDVAGAVRTFVIHRDQPALVIDLREAFDLDELLEVAERPAFLIIRAGSFLLAIQVDTFVGVRELNLRTKTPVPTGLLRDGNLPVGHLVELDGRVHTLLEPTRILSGALRDKLESFLKEARAFCERQGKIAALCEELRREPTAAGLKAYARLSRRNGQTRAANAARLVLKLLQQCEAQGMGVNPMAGDPNGDTLLRDLVALSVGRQTGEVDVQFLEGDARIFLAAGRIADACIGDEWGRAALRRILATGVGSYYFAASDVPTDSRRIEDATLWILVQTIEQLSEERRGRRRHAGTA